MLSTANIFSLCLPFTPFWLSQLNLEIYVEPVEACDFG
jgi:hypothetical protein